MWCIFFYFGAFVLFWTTACPRKQHRDSFPTPPTRSFWRKRCFLRWGSASISEVAIFKWLLRSTFAGVNWSCRGSLKLHYFCSLWSFVVAGAKTSLLSYWAGSSACLLPAESSLPSTSVSEAAGITWADTILSAHRASQSRPCFCFLSDCCLHGPLGVNWGLALPLGIQVRKVWDSQCTWDIYWKWFENR